MAKQTIEEWMREMGVEKLFQEIDTHIKETCPIMYKQMEDNYEDDAEEFGRLAGISLRNWYIENTEE